MKGQECRSRIPIQISQSETGLSQPNIFASEFGCIGMSSFESMSPLLKPEHWGLHAGLPGDNCSTSWDRECHGANPMSLRNYPCGKCSRSLCVFFRSLKDAAAHSDPALLGISEGNPHGASKINAVGQKLSDLVNASALAVSDVNAAFLTVRPPTGPAGLARC